MDSLFDSVSFSCSEVVTKRYSTSFSLGIRMFDFEFRRPIYNIYGFVRFADEIVDTYKGEDPGALLKEFRNDTFKAIVNEVSLNPILQSFQITVNKYNIDHDLITAFLDSMEMDLYKDSHSQESYEKYIYGSAEVVGLMCLRVFLNDEKRYEELKPYAKALGSAFQKVNFLRDIKSDYQTRGRTYFPQIDFENFKLSDKQLIEDDIEAEFKYALIGIHKLPKGVRFGVYTAYKYYISLFEKIKGAKVEDVMSSRIRVPNSKKLYLLTKAAVRNSLNIL